MQSCLWLPSGPADRGHAASTCPTLSWAIGSCICLTIQALHAFLPILQVMIHWLLVLSILSLSAKQSSVKCDTSLARWASLQQSDQTVVTSDLSPSWFLPHPSTSLLDLVDIPYRILIHSTEFSWMPALLPDPRICLEYNSGNANTLLLWNLIQNK